MFHVKWMILGEEGIEHAVSVSLLFKPQKVNSSVVRSIFRTLLNIYDEAILQNGLYPVTIFE